MKTRCSLWLFLGLTLTLAGNAPGGEPQSGVRGVGVPFLSRIPYVSRLFKNVAPEEMECGEERTDDVDQPPLAIKGRQVGPCVIRFVGPDGLERVGIDFDCDVCPEGRVCTHESCPAASAQCEELPPPTAVLPMPEALLEAMFEVRMEMFEALEEAHALFAEREQELISDLVEAKIAAAVAEATLKTHLEAAKHHARLEKELAAAKADNARLAAKLEVAAEKEQLAAELRHTQQELAALKSQSQAETASRPQGRTRR